MVDDYFISFLQMILQVFYLNEKGLFAKAKFLVEALREILFDFSEELCHILVDVQNVKRFFLLGLKKHELQFFDLLLLLF